MIGCTTNRNGDFSTISRGIACFASRAGCSTHDGHSSFSDLVSLFSLSTCSTSTSRESESATRSAFSAIEFHAIIGTITSGSRKSSSFRPRGAVSRSIL